MYKDEKTRVLHGSFIRCVFVSQEDLTKETIMKQFKIVRSHTNTSHVMQFGNKVGTTMKKRMYGIVQYSTYKYNIILYHLNLDLKCLFDLYLIMA